MSQDTLVSFGMGTALGLLAYIFYSSSIKRQGNTIATFIKGYSMKFHYFVWFFFLPIWIVSGLVDYSRNYDILNFFPFNLLLFVEFVCVVLNLASFIGFFRNTKYSWYCLLIGIILFLVAITIEIVIFISYSIELNSYDIGNYLGIYLPRILTIIYYIRRRPVFSNDYVFIKNRIQTTDELVEKNLTEENNTGTQLSDYIENKSEININVSPKTMVSSIGFCRKCGTKLEEGSRYCRKCGTKVEENK